MVLFDVFADDSTQNLRPHGRTIDFLATAGHIGRTSVGTYLTLYTIFQGMDEGL
jgi:hypothetical protein